MKAFGKYLFEGFQDNVDDVLIFKKKANLTVGDTFQIWYGNDWKNYSEDDNGGRHCIGVDVSCVV